MASFQEQYERLFGRKLEFDALDPDTLAPTPTGPVDTPELDTPEAVTPDYEGLVEGFRAKRSALAPATPDEPGMVGDVGRALGAGTVQTGAMGLGILEYAARQAEQHAGVDLYRDMLTPTREALGTARQATSQYSTDILAGMSQDSQDAMHRQILTLDPTKSVWRGGPADTLQALALKFSQALPATVITLLPAARLFRAGMSPGALTYMGASEGGLSLGGIANGLAEEVEGMTHEELAEESPFYNRLIEQGSDEESARTQLIAQAQGAAPLIGGLTVGAISATAGKYLEPVFTPATGMSLGQRAGRGFAGEAIQEAPQSGAEQVTQNIAAAIYDAERGVSEGVAEAMAEGLVIGGLTGGAFTSLFGARPPGPQPERTADPGAGAPPAPTGPAPTEQIDLFTGDVPPVGAVPFDEAMPPEDGVDPAVRAALDDRMSDLFVEQEQPGLHPGAAQLPLPGLTQDQGIYRPSERQLPDTVRTPGQQELPLTRRERGSRATPIAQEQPAAPTDYAPDMGAVPGVSTDPRQIDITDQPVEADLPSREPVADIQAQLAEMERPESDREAVYLSPDNVSNLQEQGLLEPLLDRGVALAGFDKPGDVLIARDNETATSLQQLRQEGAPLQEIIGLATTAGAGKPVGGDTVVQRLDESGNVVQEQLVANEAEAETLSDSWEQQYPNFDIQIRTAAAAIRVREQRVAAERAPMERKKQRAAAQKKRGPELEAAQLIGEAAKETAPQEARRIGGFFPADALEFEDPREEVKYRRRFEELTTEELKVEQGTATTQDRQKRGAVLDELAEIRQRAKPKLRGERKLRRAARVSPRTTKAAAGEARVRAKKEAEGVPQAPSMEADTDYLRGLTDGQIDSLAGNRLANAFQQAVNWTLGYSRRGTKLTYEGVEAALPELIPEGAEPVAIRTGGKSLQEVLNDINTPSEQRKYVRRVRNTLKRKEFGGTKKVPPLTKKSAEAKIQPGVHRRRGKFNTFVLTLESLPKDESRSDRVKRETRAGKARKTLDRTLRRAVKHIENLTRGKFDTLAKQRDPDTGDLTDAARDLILARAYYRHLIDFATAMQRSGNKSTAIAVEMEKLDEFLSNASRMPAEDFGRVLGNLMRAESQEQVRGLKGFRDEDMARLTDPEKRADLNAKVLQKLMANTARIKRLEENWKTNTYYNTIIAPLMHKFADSTFRDGYPSYRPTLEEVQQLQWVLDNWKIPRLREKMYTPMRRYFSDLGFKFTKAGQLIIPLDADGKYKFEIAGQKLLTAMRNKLGAEAAGSVTGYEGMPQRNRKFGVESEKDIARAGEQRDAADRMADVEQFGRYAQANRIIEKYRAIIEHPRTTIAGLIRTEQRLIRAFKELGMWEETKSPILAKIKFPRPRTYRIVGPRLESKKLLKESARTIMLRALKTQPIPADLMSDVAISRRAAQELNAETEMFLERVDPGPGPQLEQFETTASALRGLLDREAPATLNEALDFITAGLPEGHIYHTLAKQLRALNMNDIGVSWDTRGQLKKSGAMAMAKWDVDPSSATGQFRYVLMNKAKLAGAADPTLTSIHAMLHEAVHMATQSTLDRNPQVRNAVKTLREIARRNWRARHGDAKMPYGLEHLNEGEFVAEAFSNIKLQNMLKQMPFERGTIWGKFVNIVRNILGLETYQMPGNVLDAVMSLQTPLFTGEARVLKKSSELFLDMDPALRTIAESGAEILQGNMSSLRNAWERVKHRATHAPLSLMTMRQLHKEFKQHFIDHEKGNSLAQYTTAWGQRDAENSRLMKIGETISTHWTSATEKLGIAAGIEFSRLATEASLYTIHPDRPLSHESNSHITSAEQKAKHAELSKRWKAQNQQFKGLWNEVRQYYTDALSDETNLIMLNALRGVVSGKTGVMERKVFDRKYTDEKVRDMDLSQEGLAKEFPNLSAEQVASIVELASIPTKRVGPYFPMMRYGNYVVYASRTSEAKKFSKPGDAHAHAKKVKAADPTLDTHVKATATGEWTTFVTEKDFRTYETRSEATAAREEMVSQYGEEAVTDVQLKDKFQSQDTIQSGTALSNILTSLEGNTKAQNAIKNWWLQTLSDSAFRKHEITRKNRRGVNYDIQHRNFTNYVKKSSYYRSQLRYGWKMADAMRSLKDFVRSYKQADYPDGPTNERLGEIAQHLEARDRMTDDIYDVGKVIRKGSEIGQLWYLFGPSYWMINATQPWMVTMPWLAARHGAGGASAALANAQSRIASPLLKATRDSLGGLRATWSKEAAEKAFNVLDDIKVRLKKNSPDRADAYNSMLEDLREHNIIDLSWIAELRDISEGRDTGTWQRVVDGTRVLGHLTEVNNRVLTAIAAYDLQLEKAKRLNLDPATAHIAAVEFAKDAVSETHFDYSAGNKPLLFQPQGPVGRFAPWVFQFMQWPQHMYALLISNMAALAGSGVIEKKVALQTLMGIFGTHILMGGLVGAMLQPVKWAIGAAIWALGDYEDPDDLTTVLSGETYERWMREAMVSIAGKDMGHALTSGIPAGYLGVDISRRVDLGTVYYLDMRTDSAEATLGSLVTEFAGAVPNLAFNVTTRAIPTMLQGDLQRGAEYAMPKFARDISRAWRYGGDGLVNAAGDTVLSTEGISPYQLFLQTVGFQPSEISDFYARQSLIKDIELHGEAQRTALLRRFRVAETVEDRNRVLEEVKEYNRAFPHAPVTRSSLLRAIRGKAEREQSYSRYGASLRGRGRVLGSEGEFYE